MAKKRYPHPYAVGNRLSEKKPPELMTDDERREWAIRQSIKAAKVIGGTPNC